MAKEMKTYHSHSGGSFVMGFLCLLFVASYALFLFMPLFSVMDNDVVYDFTGLDFLIIGGGTYIQQVFPEVDLSNIELVSGFFSEAHTENIVVNLLANFHGILSLVSAAAIALSMAMGVFVLLLGLAWLIRGRIFVPKFTKRFASWSHGLFDLGIGVLYGYIYFLTEIQKAKGDGYAAAFGPMAFVVLGVQVAITILIGITFRLCFKNRVYEKRQKVKDDDYDATPTKNGQPQKQGAVPVYEKDIPTDIETIGDHAYSGDAALTKANIPEGVSSLGSNAFANCRNLEIVSIPQTVLKIGANCFHNTPHLKQIKYAGSKEDWRAIKRGSNWLVGSGTTTIIAKDGPIVVNPNQ